MAKGKRGGKLSSISSKRSPIIGDDNGKYTNTGIFVRNDFLEKIGKDQGVIIKNTEIIIDSVKAYQHVVLDHPKESMRPYALENWRESVSNPSKVYFDKRRKSLVYIKDQENMGFVTVISIGFDSENKKIINPRFQTTWYQNKSEIHYGSEKNKGRYILIYSKD